ncbi:MAG: hypothetical protein ACTH5C_19875 [Pseudoalteromonas prydzensis]|uniref:hypothetical protein n=1 Tax=Pseudoalteromonas prydzensis TaxID=182141 RepID=UPI003F9AD559
MKKFLICLMLFLATSSAHAKYITALNGAGVSIERVFVHESGSCIGRVDFERD